MTCCRLPDALRRTGFPRAAASARMQACLPAARAPAPSGVAAKTSVDGPPPARRGAPGRFRLRILARSLLLCTALAACAAPRAAAPVARPAAPPDWDGAYYGTSTRFRADARDCPHPGVITLYVAQGGFYYRWTYGTDIAATIAPDGTISGTGPGITLTGTVRGRRMDGNVVSATCGLHFTVARHF